MMCFMHTHTFCSFFLNITCDLLRFSADEEFHAYAYILLIFLLGHSCTFSSIRIHNLIILNFEKNRCHVMFTTAWNLCSSILFVHRVDGVPDIQDENYMGASDAARSFALYLAKACSFKSARSSHSPSCA